MPKKTTLTLTAPLHLALTRAITAMEAWNQAIYDARSLEIQYNRPGYYEHMIRTDRAHMDMRLGWSQASHWLDLIEDTIRMCGRTPQALYEAFGTPRPTVEPIGPHVDDWFEAQR